MLCPVSCLWPIFGQFLLDGFLLPSPCGIIPRATSLISSFHTPASNSPSAGLMWLEVLWLLCWKTRWKARASTMVRMLAHRRLEAEMSLAFAHIFWVKPTGIPHRSGVGCERKHGVRKDFWTSKKGEFSSSEMRKAVGRAVCGEGGSSHRTPGLDLLRWKSLRESQESAIIPPFLWRMQWLPETGWYWATWTYTPTHFTYMNTCIYRCTCMCVYRDTYIDVNM